MKLERRADSYQSGVGMGVEIPEYLKETSNFLDVYNRNLDSIRNREVRDNPVLDYINLQVIDFEKPFSALREFQMPIDYCSDCIIAFSLGYMLENTLTNSVVYFYPSPNNAIYNNKTYQIKSQKDFDNIVENDLQNQDPMKILQKPQDYYLRLLAITNVVVYIYKKKVAAKHFVCTICGGKFELRQHFKRHLKKCEKKSEKCSVCHKTILKNLVHCCSKKPIKGYDCGCDIQRDLIHNRGLVSFHKNNSNLCVFNCLAIQDNPRYYTQKAKILYGEYVNITLRQKVTLEDLPIIESNFKKSFVVYKKIAEKRYEIVYNSASEYPIIHIFMSKCDIHDSSYHFSWIKNVNLFLGTMNYCDLCSKRFAASHMLTRHKTRCHSIVKNAVCVLPHFLKSNRAIKIFSDSSDTNLELFKCIAYKKCSKNYIKLAKQLFSRYYIETGRTSVELSDLSTIEKLFDINIIVYSKCENGKINCVASGCDDYIESLTVNLYTCENSCLHFQYVRWVQKFTGLKYFKCQKCGNLFTESKKLRKHREKKNCSDSVEEVISRSIFHPEPDNVFTFLRDMYNLECIDLSNQYFIIYDFESMLKPERLITGHGENTIYTQKHEPLSVSFCSNIPGFDVDVPTLVNDYDDTDCFILDFVNRLNAMAMQARNLNAIKKKELLSRIGDIKLSKKQLKTLDNHYDRTPILAFNSAKYDIPMCRHYLFKYLDIVHCIKRNNSYISITTPLLHFLDIVQYMGVGVSYRAFLEKFQCELKKGFFPYSYMSSIEVLRETALPSKDKFYNDLANEPISDSDYESCVQIWRERNMQTFKEYLIYYNQMDVYPFKCAIIKMQQHYIIQKKVNPFRDCISLPGISQILLFRDCREFIFTTAGSVSEHDLVSEAILGGLSIILKRYSKSGVTSIKPYKYTEPEIVKRIIGLDCNSLYSYCMQQDMPVGFHLYRKFDVDKLMPQTSKKTRLFYTKELQWLLLLSIEKKINIRTYAHVGGQMKIEGRYVDGYYYNEELNLHEVYQFDGCWYHDCKECYIISEEKQKDKKEFNEMLKQKPNFKVTIMIEHDFKAFLDALMPDQTETRRTILEKQIPPTLLYRRPISTQTLLQHILENKYYGLVKCSVAIDIKYHSYYENFPPIFITREVGEQDISDYMSDYCENQGIDIKPQKMLISVMKAENAVFISDQIKWYLMENIEWGDNVFIITNITESIQYIAGRPFAKFVEAGVNERIQGDLSKEHAINSVVSKCLLNSSYGKLIQNKLKQRDVVIIKNDSDKLAREISSVFFGGCEEITADIYEVIKKKKKIVHNLPRHIGAFVYGKSKLVMLSFIYDFIVKYFRDSSYAFLFSDTDSIYLEISEENLDLCVKDEYKSEYQKIKYDWLVNPDISRSCRQPGLFKIEKIGLNYIGLSSKCYYIEGFDTHKWAAKGISHRTNHLTFQHYEDVLFRQNNHYIENRGIKVYNNRIHSYKQTRCGLKNLYLKRVVDADGIHTWPLLE